MVHHSAALADQSGDEALAETVVSGSFDELGAQLSAMCRYAVKLTLAPDEMRADDLAPLRDVGLGDRDIIDLNQVVSYFNYVNRVADGLGVELKEHWPSPASAATASGTGDRRATCRVDLPATEGSRVG